MLSYMKAKLSFKNGEWNLNIPMIYQLPSYPAARIDWLIDLFNDHSSALLPWGWLNWVDEGDNDYDDEGGLEERQKIE